MRQSTRKPPIGNLCEQYIQVFLPLKGYRVTKKAKNRVYLYRANVKVFQVEVSITWFRRGEKDYEVMTLFQGLHEDEAGKAILELCSRCGCSLTSLPASKGTMGKILGD